MASYPHYGSLPRGFFDLKKGHNLKEEIQCYSLPYGGLGFTSHLLTYYTIIVLSTGRSPLRPWRKLSNSRIDMWLSTISLIGAFMVAVFTLVRCRNHWQLLVIGIWKVSMSMFNGAVGVHIAVIMREFAKKEFRADVMRPRTENVWLWVLLYFPGMIAGFVGLVSLMIQNWDANHVLRTVTYVFSGIMGTFAMISVIGLLVIMDTNTSTKKRLKLQLPLAFFIVFVIFASLSALFGDWTLGAMANNLVGTPSGDSSGLFWSYFVLKRFTMLSF